MARRHAQGTNDDAGASPEEAVTQKAADQRCKGDQAHIEPKDLRSEGLGRQGPEHLLEAGAKACKAGNILHMTWQEQLPDHVEDQQGLHAIEGNSVPDF